MTSSGQGSVSYLCPRCQAALTAQSDDAGQRQECPHCGKTVKVPGTPKSARKSPASSPTPAAPRPTAPVQEGIANIAVLCTVCGTRMYATREQAGQTMVCPDCLETVTIPRSSVAKSGTAPAKPRRTSRSTPPREPTTNKSRPTPSTASTPIPGGDADEEMRLSDPVDVPADRFLPTALTNALQDATDASAPQSGTEPPSAPAAPRDHGPVDDGAFAVKCPTCDTLVYVTADEIGQQKTCPDCFSIVEVTQPRPKPRRVNEVVDADYEGHTFKLSEPVSLDIYHRTERGLDPKTLGEEALRKAEQAYDERKKGEAELPEIPLWDGLFRFLPHLSIVGRLVLAAALLGGAAKLAMAAVVLAGAGHAAAVLALILTFFVIALFGVACTFTFCTCLWILQESANGHDEITDWPELLQLLEWPLEALPAALAVFYAILPGLGVFLLAGVLGMPASTRWIFLLVSLYLFLPITQLSLLESDSLTMPASPAILGSLSKDFLLWATLYLMTFAIALLVALTLSLTRITTPTVVVMLLAVVWVLGIFLYYRLLGRVAWACQVRLLRQRAEPKPGKH
jgi:DNA-directed RNA polymerase subunit M/transcription elongation factor TFIIS